MSITIYRMQDADGRGPFKPGFSHKWVESRKDHANLIPWTAEFGRVDLSRTPGYHVGCGCLSLDQLRRWFTKREAKTLRKFGYECVTFNADRILAESSIQCVFERQIPLASGCKVIRLYEESKR